MHCGFRMGARVMAGLFSCHVFGSELVLSAYREQEPSEARHEWEMGPRDKGMGWEERWG